MKERLGRRPVCGPGRGMDDDPPQTVVSTHYEDLTFVKSIVKVIGIVSLNVKKKTRQGRYASC